MNKIADWTKAAKLAALRNASHSSLAGWRHWSLRYFASVCACACQTLAAPPLPLLSVPHSVPLGAPPPPPRTSTPSSGAPLTGSPLHASHPRPSHKIGEFLRQEDECSRLRLVSGTRWDALRGHCHRFTTLQNLFYSFNGLSDISGNMFGYTPAYSGLPCVSAPRRRAVVRPLFNFVFVQSPSVLEDPLVCVVSFYELQSSFTSSRCILHSGYIFFYTRPAFQSNVSRSYVCFFRYRRLLFYNPSIKSEHPSVIRLEKFVCKTRRRSICAISFHKFVIVYGFRCKSDSITNYW